MTRCYDYTGSIFGNMNTELEIVNFVQNRCGVSFEVADPISQQLKEDRSMEFISTKTDDSFEEKQFSLHRLIERLDMAEKRRKQILDRRTKRLKLKRQRYRHFLHQETESCVAVGQSDSSFDEFDVRLRDRTSSSISFDIVFDDSSSENRGLDGFKSAKQKQKERRQLTVEDIENKLRIAESRRMKYEERRLQRMKARQNAVRSIARNVELLMELRAAFPEVEADRRQQHLSQTDAVAKRISRSFVDLKDKTVMCDLAIPKAESLHDSNRSDDNTPTSANLETEATPSLVVSEPKAKGTNLSYSIEFEVNSPEKCASPPPGNLTRASPVERRLTREELNLKLEKAEERRQKRLAERSRRAAASREALLAMANKIDVILDHQNPSFELLMKQTALFGRRLTGQEIRQMAAEVAEGFEAITDRYRKDIDLARTLEKQLKTS